MPTNELRQFGRAKNSVLTFLENRLAVPRIYMDAIWNGVRVDLLAIDRDGVGDVHIALLFQREYRSDNGRFEFTAEARAIDGLLDKFESIPAQFKYIVAVEPDTQRGAAPLRLSESLNDRSFAPDGVGRVGLALVDFLLDGEPQTRLIVKPERFRAKVGKLADEYVLEHTADWEIRA